MLIAVGEACANAIEHAGAEPGSTIEVRAQIVGREVVLRILDHGHWRSAAARSERGHGLRLMRVLMDRDPHRQRGRGNAGGAEARCWRRAKTRRRRLPPAATPRARRAAAERDRAGAGASIAFERAREVTVARLEGEVDVVGARRARPRRSTHATRAGDRGLVLDVNGVGYLDSAGLHLLHDTSRTLAARGQALRVVVAPDAEIARLLELVDIVQTVPVDGSVDEAVDALASPPVL